MCLDTYEVRRARMRKKKEFRTEERDNDGWKKRKSMTGESKAQWHTYTLDACVYIHTYTTHNVPWKPDRNYLGRGKVPGNWGKEVWGVLGKQIWVRNNNIHWLTCPNEAHYIVHQLKCFLSVKTKTWRKF